jgi:hypothetical protein
MEPEPLNSLSKPILSLFKIHPQIITKPTLTPITLEREKTKSKKEGGEMHGKRGDHNTVSLSVCLTCRVPLLSPILSSSMDTVTEGAMAATMASLGGLGIVHSNLSTADQASVVRSVKSHRVPILSTPTFLAPSNRIHSLHNFDSYPYILVTQSGSTSSQLLDYVSRSDWFKGVEEFGRLFREKLKDKIVFFMPA